MRKHSATKREMENAIREYLSDDGDDSMIKSIEVVPDPGHPEAMAAKVCFNEGQPCMYFLCEEKHPTADCLEECEYAAWPPTQRNAGFRRVTAKVKVARKLLRVARTLLRS